MTGTLKAGWNEHCALWFLPVKLTPCSAGRLFLLECLCATVCWSVCTAGWMDISAASFGNLCECAIQMEPFVLTQVNHVLEIWVLCEWVAALEE